MIAYNILVVENEDNIVLQNTIMAESRRDAYFKIAAVIPHKFVSNAENVEIMVKEFLSSSCDSLDKIKTAIKSSIEEMNKQWESNVTDSFYIVDYSNNTEFPNRMMLIDVLALIKNDNL